MLKNITCPCGQQLDVSDFSAGDQVQCPQCQQIHTVGAAAAVADVPMAVAVALPDDDDALPAGGLSPKGGPNDFVNRRKRAQKRAAAQASSALQRVLVWPALAFALLAMAIGGMGLYMRTIPPRLERITEDGIERLYAQVPIRTMVNEDGEVVPLPNLDEANLKFERIEVQPDIYPGDKVRSRGSYQPGESPFLLNGEPLDWRTFGRDELKQRVFGVAVKAEDGVRMIPVVRRGLWFYRLEDGKAVERLDLPLIGGVVSGASEYEPVVFYNQNFHYRRDDGKMGDPVDVAWYRVSAEGVQEQPMTVGQFREQLFMGLRPNQVANVFALAGFGIGLVLLGLGGLMLYGSFLSPAAKQQAAQRRAFAEEQKSKQTAAV